MRKRDKVNKQIVCLECKLLLNYKTHFFNFFIHATRRVESSWVASGQGKKILPWNLRRMEMWDKSTEESMKIIMSEIGNITFRSTFPKRWFMFWIRELWKVTKRGLEKAIIFLMISKDSQTILKRITLIQKRFPKDESINLHKSSHKTFKSF